MNDVTEGYDKCLVCEKSARHEFFGICPDCEQKFGPHLAQSLSDVFDFAFGLKNGDVFKIIGGTATIRGEWLILPEIDDSSTKLSYPFPRGLQIRLSEIAWVAAAPEGS